MSYRKSNFTFSLCVQVVVSFVSRNILISFLYYKYTTLVLVHDWLVNFNVF